MIVWKVYGKDGETPSTMGLINISQYDSDKQTLEKKAEYVNQQMPNANSLVKKQF